MPHPAVPAVGDPMPDLVLIGPDGRRATLSEVAAGRRAIVLFMRTSTCPICLAHAAEIERLIDAGTITDAAFVLVPPGGAVEAATAETRARVRSGAAMRAEVRASGTEHGSVGLGRFLGLQHSGTFILAADGRILAVRTSVLPTGAFSRDEAIAALSPATLPSPPDRG